MRGCKAVRVCPGIFAEVSGRNVELLMEAAGKGRGIVETAGEGDLRDGIAGGAEHFHSHPELGGELLFFHKDPVKIRPVDTGIAGHVGNPDRIGIVVFQILFCFLKVDLGRLLRGFRGFLFHKGKEQQEVSGGRKLVLRTLEKSLAEPFHLFGEGDDGLWRLIPKGKGLGKNSAVEKLRNGFPVEPHPGIAPGILLICLIIGHFCRGNEKGIPRREGIGLAFVLVNPLTL